jgi:hypothetical protein
MVRLLPQQLQILAAALQTPCKMRIHRQITMASAHIVIKAAASPCQAPAKLRTRFQNRSAHDAFSLERLESEPPPPRPRFLVAESLAVAAAAAAAEEDAAIADKCGRADPQLEQSRNTGQYTHTRL